ncbi:LysR family transcriptional regulator [Niveibacterium sp. SC-1]|uniref:LysR family transcriptional regulator n=1 Tax=Niveibacterium sp. SC-1 TaxID=3135646 RepID=UPI00311F71D8
MKLSLDALAMLDAIDTRGSFAAAAEALHRVPSALTHAVRKLEDDLGFPIFEKVGRRAVLTDAGRTLLRDGRVLLQAAGELERRAKRVATGWEAELRIAVEGTLDLDSLLPIVAEFYADYGGTRISLLHEVLGGMWDALATGRADLAIGAPGDPPAGSAYALRQWGQAEFCFCIAPHHPLANLPDPLPVETVRRYRAVVMADTSRELLARTAGLLEGQDTLTVPNLSAKLAAQVAGLGVGNLPQALAQREAEAGRLQIRRVGSSRLQVPFWLAWQPEHRGRALQWFVERLSEVECVSAFLRR